MGASKSQLFSESQNELANAARVLAHPARIAILEILAGEPGCMCGSIVDKLPLAQPTVSQHLRELKQAGFVKGEIEGASVCYCLDGERLEAFGRQLGGFLEQIRPKTGCC